MALLHGDTMTYRNVEDILFQGEPSFVWLERVNEDDIVQYVGIKPPTEFHPDVIPLICRYPFRSEDNVLFVCQQFLKLLIAFDRYLYTYRERSDVLAFVGGFFEAAGYTPAISQLVFHRNLLLKQGYANQSVEVISLNHAIQNLYGLRFRNPWSGLDFGPTAVTPSTDPSH